MNYDYIREELDLLLKDTLISNYQFKFENEELSSGENKNNLQIKNIIITTIENNKLEISLNDNFCYKIDRINCKKIDEKLYDKHDNSKNKDTELFEDLNILLGNYSPNYRNRFNELIKDKLFKLQEN
jgi:hypothetical protein